MAYRYTYTEKWSDAWFSDLKPSEKLLFIYLYENCDIAGFIELNLKRWSSDLGINTKGIEGALKGLQRGLIIAETKDCYFVKSFLRHQKNLPLNPQKNMAHRGIVKRFDIYKNKFNINNIDEFIEGASKGLQCPYGNGNGNGNDILEKGGVGGKSVNIPFETFWNMYDKKEDKIKCERKWRNLTDAERNLCIAKLPEYINSTPDKQFRKNPATYLNNKSWENEIIKPNDKNLTPAFIPRGTTKYITNG